MRTIMEVLFNSIYLISVVTIGLVMIMKSEENKQFKLFGLMAVLLGAGDAFHLLPRSYALLTTGLEANAAALGVGKLVTSITMTIFYIILYHIWRIRYGVEGRKGLTLSIYALSIMRIVICLFPQNQWLNYYAPVSWGIYRNIPFAIMGIIIICIFYSEVRKHNNSNFKFMWLAITLSFALYAPVVLLSDTISWIGALMIPKTIAYVWIVIMGYQELRANKKKITQNLVE